MLRRVLLAALIAATLDCSKSSPAGPTTPIDSPLRGLSITGSTSVPPGSSIQLTALAFHVNGASEDVTAQATWTSSDPSVLQVAAGRAQGLADGEAIVTVQYSTTRATRTVVVLEPGTFTVTGSITDGASGLSSARLDVVSGRGAGRFVTTTTYGGYRIFGLAGPAELRASADGYVSRSQTVNVASNMSLSFTLTPVVPPTDVSGAWQLTIDASPSCTGLGDIGRHRTYTAAITQNVAGLRVVLGGAAFERDPAYGGAENIFYGRIIEKSVTLNLTSFEYYGLHYDLAETLPDGAGIYTAVGTGTGTVNGGTIAIALSGTLTVTAHNTPTTCVAADHRLTLVRASTATARR